MKYVSFFLFFFFIFLVHCYSPEEELNVFVVPHSHCDPGWWKTFEDYYNVWTKNIISSVVDALLEDERRTFIWTEISFFERWWQEQDVDKKSKVRDLAKRGNLEFVTGGWVAVDEANTHYTSIISQLMEGNEWLQSNLGVAPKIGWSIDPFGHSPVMPWILSQIGLDGIVINRVHKNTKQSFRENEQLEFIWRQQWQDPKSTNASYDMFTHMLAYGLYDIPNTCGPDWKICAQFDFERPQAVEITDSNIKERSTTLLSQYRKKAQHFSHNNLLIPLGDDFKYKTLYHTKFMFDNYQKMFDYINQHRELKVNIKFATLSEYFHAVHQESHAFPIYHGDFFPYNDKNEDYWSGYFTTRPYLKYLSRKAESILRTAENLYSLASIYGNSFDRSSGLITIEQAKRHIGLFQHHDGITGTARALVVKDYNQKLSQSIESLRSLTQEFIPLLLRSSTSVKNVMNSKNEQPGLTIILESDKLISVYNPLNFMREQVIKLHVSSIHVEVRDSNGQKVLSQIGPIWENPGQASKDKFSLHFTAKIPPLGISTYSLIPSSSKEDTMVSKITLYSSNLLLKSEIPGLIIEHKELESVMLENSHLKVHFTEKGMIEKVIIIGEDKSIQLGQGFQMYSAIRSGAYIFAPSGPSSPVPQEKIVLHLVSGPLVQELYVTFTSESKNLIQQRVSIYEISPDVIEISNFISLDSTFTNKELITKYSTNLKNGGIFYTDSNGYDMQTREVDTTLPIQANYYPVTQAASIKDNEVQFEVFTQQAMGVGSLTEGTLEIMMDRRCSADDGRGLGEGVLDNVPFEMVFWLSVTPTSKINEIASQRRALLLNNRLELFLHDSSSTPLEFSPLKNQPFPENVHMLSFKPRSRSNDQLVLQLYNFMSTESSSVNLDSIFAHHKVINSKAHSLSFLSELKGTMERSLYKANEQSKLYKLPKFSLTPSVKHVDINNEELEIYPKQISTFLLELRLKKEEKPQGVDGGPQKPLEPEKPVQPQRPPVGRPFEPIKEKPIAHSKKNFQLEERQGSSRFIYFILIIGILGLLYKWKARKTVNSPSLPIFSTHEETKTK